MSARHSKQSAASLRAARLERPQSAVHMPQAAKAVAHVGFAPVGEVGLLAVVLRYSRAVWAQWLDYDASSADFGEALILATRHFGGVPRRWVFEEADCRVLSWDGRRARFAFPLEVVAQQTASSLSLWHNRYCGPATRACERLIWETPCPRWRERLRAGNAVLRQLLRETLPHWSHPQQPSHSVADVFAEERAELLPLPESWAVLDGLSRGGEE